MKKLALGLAFISIMILVISVKADFDPDFDPQVAWHVTDHSGNPVNGAMLTIYWATSTDGPFEKVPGDRVNDVIAGTYQNPITTGYWNKNHSAGIAFCNIDTRGYNLNRLYFYVKIEYDSTVEYWPTALSYKPGDQSWAPVAASESPSGYAAAGNGIGNGVTTAYPTHVCPPQQVVPEVPLGTVLAMVSMVSAFGAYFGLRKRKFLTR